MCYGKFLDLSWNIMKSVNLKFLYFIEKEMGDEYLWRGYIEIIFKIV